MKEKLLVLDDELLILMSLEHLFEDDYEVLTASNGDAALELAAHNEIGVILCDERMPHMSGHEFLRRVRSISGATRIMMSGYADFKALVEAVNYGQIFAIVAKPWNSVSLKGLVRSAMEHYKQERQIDCERELLRTLVEGDAAPAGPTIQMDQDGSVTAWNPQAEMALGWTATEIMGSRLCDTVVAPASRTDVLTFLSGESRCNRAIEMVAVHRDGREPQVQATIWRTETGGAASFKAFLRDSGRLSEGGARKRFRTA